MEKNAYRYRQLEYRNGLKNYTTAFFFVCMNFSFIVQMSQLSESPLGGIISIVFSVMGIGFLLFHLILDAKIPTNWFFGTLVLIAIGIITFIYSRGPTLLKLILFFYAVKRVEKEKVMKYFRISLLIPSVIVAASSLLGITNIQYTGLKMALSFGMLNPNTVPVIIFAIIVAYNLEHEDDLNYWDIFIEVIVASLTFYFCRARTAGLVLTGYFLMIIIVKWWGERRFVRFLLLPFQFFFPICSGISIALSIAFRSLTPFWITVNNLTSGRLLAWSRYLDTYGVSLFGNNVVLNRGSLDNAYMQLLIKYGLIVFVAYLVLFVIVSKFAYKNHRMVLLVSVLATEMYCVAEFGPLLANFCPVLIYLACILINEQDTMFYQKDQVKSVG